MANTIKSNRKKNLSDREIYELLQDSDIEWDNDTDNIPDEDDMPESDEEVVINIIPPITNSLYTDADDFDEPECGEIDENPKILVTVTNEITENEIIIENVDFEFIDEMCKFKTTLKENIQWRHRAFESNPIVFEMQAAPIILEAESSPLYYFSKYIPNNLFESMAFYTNLYAAQKSFRSYKSTNANEMKVFAGIHILMGSLKLPRVRLYWNNNIYIKTISESMTLERFYQLRSALHFVNNLEEHSAEDKFYKTRPLIECIRNRCLELPLERDLSVDEQMIPFKGKLNIKQYIKGKPCPWGIKVFFLCGKSGQPYDFILYQGSNTEISKSLQKQYGVGASVVLHLAKRITQPGHYLFADNYFTSYNLFEILKQMGINSAGTVRVNRFAKPAFLSDKDMKKKGRGCSDELVSRDGNICLIKWFDNKPVFLASNFVGKGNEEIVNRFNKAEKKYEDIQRPQVVTEYVSSMGGVDTLNQLISYYRIFIKSKKWTLRVFAHFLDLAVVASWIEYRKLLTSLNSAPKDIEDLLEFRLHLGKALAVQGEFVRKRGRPLAESFETENLKKTRNEIRPIQEIRYDSINHLPHHDVDKNPSRCKNTDCSSKTRVYCKKCNVHLCFTGAKNCFLKFHTKN